MRVRGALVGRLPSEYSHQQHGSRGELCGFQRRRSAVLLRHPLEQRG